MTPGDEDGVGVLRAWFELAPDAMLAVDERGRVLLANARAEALFGYAPSELTGSSVETLLAESRQYARATVGHLFSAMHAHAADAGQALTGRRRDGREFPVELALADVALAPGRITLASLRDVSDTPRTRQALARARHDVFVARIGELAVESPDHESAIRAIPGLVAEALEVPAVAILSSDWHRNAFRIRAATGLSATTADALTGIFGDGELSLRTFAERDRAPITSGGSANETATAIAAGLARTRYRHFALVSLFGRYEPLGILIALASSDAAFNPDKVAFLQAVANLLTATVQRSHAEEQLAHAQRLDAVGQLTGGIAHDFNNLLTVVSGNLQMLEADLAERPQTRDLIESALRAVGRGAELTRKLLAFARRQSLRPRALEPAPLLADMGRLLRRTLGESIAIQIDCADDLPAVFADPAELETALVNLALNARDAMPRGGRLAIAARAVDITSADNEWNLAPGQYVAIKVGDTGTGMAQDVQARACEPFFTTKGGGKGSGLGLSMVYGFVTQSGGRMAIDSRLGYGTRVEIFLPVAAEPVRAPRQPASAEAARSEQRGTILVVEDEIEVREIAAAFLREMGYEVLATGGASEALQLLAAHPQIDLLFSDVVLGGTINGVELAQAARRARPQLVVLLTSGYPGAASGAGDADAQAAFPLLHKPYRREQLAEAVRAALAARIQSVQRAG